jgi:hypothetical protein
VEFSVFAPSRVSAHETFPINVSLDFYQGEDRVEYGGSREAYETVVVDLKGGSLVGLGLESEHLQIDAPYQLLQWEHQPLTAVFITRLTGAEGNGTLKAVQCTLHIMVNGYPLGHIPFELKIDAGSPTVLKTGEFSPVVLNRQMGSLALEGQGKGALQYKDVFLSYSVKDLKDVTHLADGLKLGGVKRIRMDRTDLSPTGEDWDSLVQRQMDECETVLLCWSSNAAGDGEGTDAIRKEIDYALKLEELEEKKRSGFRLVVFMIGDVYVPPPKKIRRRTATSVYFQLRRTLS